MNETRKLAQFITEITYDDFPDEVIDKTKELVLDQLGCQLSGSTLPSSKKAYAYIKDNKGQRGESTVVNYGLKTIAPDAAFANGTFGHAFMAEDTDTVCHAHLGSVLLPAVLAIGEREMISGKEFIKGMVVAYDVASRIGAAATMAENRGFHPGATFGTFGASAGVGTILGFNENQVINALGIAGSHSCGLLENSKGGTVSHLHSGIAASNGLRCALLAQQGFSGAATILEGENGFLHAFSGESSTEEITSRLANEFRVLLIGLKPYCCCGTSIAGIDAVSKITREHDINTKEIKEIIVNASPETYKLTATIEPTDVTSAQLSGRFSIALRLIKGGNGFNEYTESNIRDSEILDLTARIKYILDEDLAKTPESENPTKVTIRLIDGTVHEETVYAGKGSILNPMTHEEVCQKFREFASMVLPEKNNVEAIIKTVEELDSINNIRELSQLLVTS